MIPKVRFSKPLRSKVADEEQGLAGSPNNGTPAVPRTDTENDFLAQRGNGDGGLKLESMDIMRSRWQGDDGVEKVRLTKRPFTNSEGTQPCLVRWRHIKSDRMDMQTFESLATKTAGIVAEDQVIIGTLLKRFRDIKEKEFIYGRYFESGAMRCDGFDQSPRPLPSKSATFLCLPYFSSQSPRTSRDKTAKGSVFHSARTLLQLVHRLAGSEQRDNCQTVRKAAATRDMGGGGELLHVPEFWALVVNNSRSWIRIRFYTSARNSSCLRNNLGTIVTYAQFSLSDLLAKSIDVDEDCRPASSEGPRFVKFNDDTGRSLLAPIEQCKTWFEMVGLITCAGNNPGSFHAENYEFFLKTSDQSDEIAVTDQNWSSAIEEATAFVVTLSISRKRASAYPVEDWGDAPPPRSHPGRRYRSGEGPLSRGFRDRPDYPTSRYSGEYFELSRSKQTRQESDRERRPYASVPKRHRSTYHAPLGSDNLIINNMDGGTRLTESPTRSPTQIAFSAAQTKHQINSSYDPPGSRYPLTGPTEPIVATEYWEPDDGEMMADQIRPGEGHASSSGSVPHRGSGPSGEESESGWPDNPLHAPEPADNPRASGIVEEDPLESVTSTIPEEVTTSGRIPEDIVATSGWTHNDTGNGDCSLRPHDERVGEAHPDGDQQLVLRNPNTRHPRTHVPVSRALGGYGPIEVKPGIITAPTMYTPSFSDTLPYRYKPERLALSRESRAMTEWPEESSLELHRQGQRKHNYSMSSDQAAEDWVYVEERARRPYILRPPTVVVEEELSCGEGGAIPYWVPRRGGRWDERPRFFVNDGVGPDSDIYYIPTAHVDPPSAASDVLPGNTPPRTTKREQKQKQPDRRRRAVDYIPERTGFRRRRSESLLKEQFSRDRGPSPQTVEVPRAPSLFTWPTGKILRGIRDDARSETDIQKSLETITRNIHTDLLENSTLREGWEGSPKEEGEIYRDIPPRTLQDVEAIIQAMENEEAAIRKQRNVIGELLALRKRVVRKAKEILDFFIPDTYACDVSHKYWGSVQILITIESPSFARSLLRSCGYILLMLTDILSEIHAGVSNTTQPQRSRYPIPKGLVEAFRHIVMLLVLPASSRLYPPSLKPDVQELICLHQMESRGVECENLLHQGKFQLIAMIYTEDFRDGAYDVGAAYEPVSPASIVGSVVGRLLKGTSTHGKGEFDVMDVYDQYTSSLVLQVQDKPSTRLLQDINYVAEELRIIGQVCEDQLKALNNYEYCAIEPTRLEEVATTRNRRDVEKRIRDIGELWDRAEGLSSTAVGLLEIQKEDHGKAIFIFTLVTIIFLPMSFVTGYLGMNTTDIRATGRGQGFFWAIALPLTVGVMGGALLVAFGREEMKGRLAGGFQKVRVLRVFGSRGNRGKLE
ncbi:MAG: hypothetical protein M1839_003520 [Geoglossum umbratile]|nr:MAG: hypothetical protein M1839_003520 [Geoglossum umbratile]